MTTVAHSFAQIDVGLIGSVVAAIAAVVAAGVAIATLLKVKDQIHLAEAQLKLAREELEAVQTELGIIGKAADLHLGSMHLSNSVTAGCGWGQYPDTNTQMVGWYNFDFSILLTNQGTKAVPEATIYFWLPPLVRPQAVAPEWRDEVRTLEIDGTDNHLWTYAIHRRIYPKPFRTVEQIYMKKDVPRATYTGAGRPTPVRFYWQLVCDDGTFPVGDRPADFTARFADA